YAGTMKRTLVSRQQKWAYVLFGLFTCLLVNSLLLFLMDTNLLAAAYRGTLLFHLFTGTLFILPLGIFLAIHIWTMPHKENLLALTLGIGTFLFLLGIFVTGWLLYDEDFADQKSIILAAHIICVVGSLGCAIIHIAKRRKRVYHFFVPPTKKAIARSPHWRIVYRWALMLSSFVFLLFVLAFYPLERTGPELADNPIQPGEVKILGENFFHPTTLDGSQSCGETGCHPDIHKQWSESVHKFSSFNNPYYKKSIEVLLTSNNVSKAKWCASCHDPLMLTAGVLKGDGLALIETHPLREKGITCLSCHAVKGAKDISGNGNYMIQDPGYESMGRTFWGEVAQIRTAVIQTKPEPHAAGFMDAHLTTEAFCVSCHKVSVPPAVNDYRWKRGQNQYDAWYNSSFSQKHPRSFYVREKESCVSCHMSKVPSTDKGNDNGFVRNHRFASANTAIPFLNGHVEQVEAVIAFLKNKIATIDIFRVHINGKLIDPESQLPVMKGGDEVRVEVLVANKETGHSLPAGTNDSNEWWLEMKAASANGQLILASGLLDDQLHVDSTAHFFNAILLDKDGNLINKRNVHEWHATVYNRSIPSGNSRIIRYTFNVPPEEEIFQLSARLLQRKFTQAFHELTFSKNEVGEREIAPLPKLPITEVATASRMVGPDSSNIPVWKRWNDYGIAALFEENFQLALRAFQKASSLQPDDPLLKLNQARTWIMMGSLEKAEEMLVSLLASDPQHTKVQYFLAKVYFSTGRYEEALELWEEVLSSYPQDQILLSDMGQIYYLMGNYGKAEDLLLQALEVDPERQESIYRYMLVLGAGNKLEEMEKWRNKYEYHKQNEKELEVVAAFKKSHPIQNLESQIVHYHSLKLILE
ncbi:MAG: tetratricopeptide repeat protein, partial [Bacteroidota bacterium]